MSYFGKQYSKFMSAVKSGKNPKEWADKNLLVLGSGSSRIAYTFQDNRDIVLKIIADHLIPSGEEKNSYGFDKQRMIDSNKWESDLRMQQRYVSVFPRTYARAKDSSWIISEAVDRVKNWNQLFDLLHISQYDISAEKFKAVYLPECIEYFVNPDSFVRNLRQEQNLKEDKETFVDSQISMFSGNSKTPVNGVDFDDSSDPDLLEQRKIFESLLSDRHNNRVFAAMGDLSFPIREFEPKNLGVSRESGKLVILDASLWKKYKQVNEVKKMKTDVATLKVVIREAVRRLVEDAGTKKVGNYVVRKGDTLSGITSSHSPEGVTLEDNAKLNNLSAPYSIRQGQTLKIWVSPEYEGEAGMMP